MSESYLQLTEDLNAAIGAGVYLTARLPVTGLTPSAPRLPQIPTFPPLHPAWSL